MRIATMHIAMNAYRDQCALRLERIDQTIETGRSGAMAAVGNKELGFDPNEYDTNPVETAYRDALADGLERVLETGAETLADIVKGLNELSAFASDGSAWTEGKLAAELSRLGR